MPGQAARQAVSQLLSRHHLHAKRWITGPKTPLNNLKTKPSTLTTISP